MTLPEEIKALTWWNEPSKLKSILNKITGNLFVDAPQDGNQYARQDGAWAEVESGGAPIKRVLNAKLNISSNVEVVASLTELENTLGNVNPLVTTKVGLGQYEINSVGAFVGTLFAPGLVAPNQGVVLDWVKINDNTLVLIVRNNDLSISAVNLTPSESVEISFTMY
jgi:hypothetical protein